MNKAGGADKSVLRPEQKDLPPGNAIMEHIGIICRNWCRKHKIEMTWIINEELTGEEFDVTKEIYRGYLEHCKNQESGFSDYNNYKDLMLKLLKEILENGFKEFNRRLVQGDNKTWKLFDRRMRQYVWIWSKNKGVSLSSEDINTCYFSALSTLYEKLSLKKMTFVNSHDLKSYFFRIFENKTLENYRVNRRYLMTTNNLPELIYEDTGNDNDEILTLLKKNIRKLAYNEQYILMAYFLYEKKLTEIATELGITAENCRVIKHRTINRLINLLPKDI
jgi:RNA polymerase sigma factor (sigma-70 family)